MAEPADLVVQGENSTTAVLENLTTRMQQALTQNQIQTQATTHDPSTIQIGIKLNGTNYALWSQMMEMYISSKDKLGYITESEPMDPVGIMVFDPTPLFKRPRQINAHRPGPSLKPKYPHTNTDSNHDPNPGLWTIRSKQRPTRFITWTHPLLASCRL